MNTINEIYRFLGEDCILKVGVFGDGSVAFYIGASEFPIYVEPSKNRVYVDFDGLEYTLDSNEFCEYSFIMSIIFDNMQEIKGWVK